MDEKMCMKTEEDYLETISRLRKELSNRDKDIELAATFGKQLLEENWKFNAKVENYSTKNELLEQEKHSLVISLDLKTETLKIQANEVEYQRDRADTLAKSNELLQKENSQLNKKNKDLLKENEYIRKIQENLNLEYNACKKKNSLQEAQLKGYQDQHQVSFYETDNEEFLKLQRDLSMYMTKNNEMEDVISEYQSALDQAKVKEERLTRTVIELEEEVLDRDKEISSYSTEVKKSQDEIFECRAEIEALKFEQVDVNRRGNSVFAELDDRRLLVEKEYIELKQKFQNMYDKFDDNRKDLQKTKGQMALLLGMASQKSDTTYIEELENSLFSARKEVEHLTNKLIKQVKQQQETLSSEEIVEKAISKGNGYDYLRVLLQQSQEKITCLEKELMTLRTSKVVDNAKLVETQRLLYKTDKDLSASRGENLKLKLQISELTHTQDASAKVKSKPNVELLPGFKPNKETHKILKKSEQDVKENYIIPRELELKENGFVETKPSRISNLWALHEYNIPQNIKQEPETSDYAENKNAETVVILHNIENKNINKKVDRKSTQKIVNTRHPNCVQQ